MSSSRMDEQPMRSESAENGQDMKVEQHMAVEDNDVLKEEKEQVSTVEETTAPMKMKAEIRGRRELLLVQPEIANTRPLEVEENDIPSQFTCPDTTTDTLRLLTDFYFCTADGNPISLDILEAQKDKRPEIMGFGTLVQPVSMPELAAIHDSILVPVDEDLETPKRRSSKKRSRRGSTKAKGISPKPLDLTKLPKIRIVCSPPSNEDQDESAKMESSTPSAVDSVPKVDEQATASQSETAGDIASDDNMDVVDSSPEKQSSNAIIDTPTKTAPKAKKSGAMAAMTEDDWNLVECGFFYPSKCERMRVFLPRILDWCLDYSTIDPTLWLITEKGWYKIAGPISGMLPHWSYRSTFEHVRRLFEACYRAAHVLTEWLPVNKVSYQRTLNQIVDQSSMGRYPVTSEFFMENYDFIVNQVADLEKDDSEVGESTFFRHLRRLRDNYVRRVEKTRKHKAEVEERRRIREKERDERRKKKEDEISQKRAAREALLAIRKAKRLEAEKYPMEDIQLMEEIQQNGGTILPMPKPKASDLAPAGVLGDIVMAWQMLATFSETMELSSISLELLCAALQYTNAEVVVLNEMFTTLIKPILVEGSFKNENFAIADGQVRFGARYVRAYGIEEISLDELFSQLTWQEVLRQMIARDGGMDSSLGYIEPLAGCEVVLRKIQLQHNVVPFSSPVDVDALDDYAEIVKLPMDLGTISDRLRTGYYETDDDSAIPGYHRFRADVRLVWDNAILFNGEDSVLGRSALAFSDMFEQEFQDVVMRRVQLNTSWMKKREDMKLRIDDPAYAETFNNTNSIRVSDVVTALAVKDFYQVRVSMENGVKETDYTSDTIDAKVTTYYDALREVKREEREEEIARRQFEKARQEKLEEFQAQNPGINIESENINENEKYTAFMASLEESQSKQDELWSKNEEDRQEKLSTMQKVLNLRVMPLGMDRYFNRYWIFDNDQYGRIFVENVEHGAYLVYTTEAEVQALLTWLNPKGKREAPLIKVLRSKKKFIIPLMKQCLRAPPSPPDVLSFRNVKNIGRGMVKALPSTQQFEGFVDILYQELGRDTIRRMDLAKRMLMFLETQLCGKLICGKEWIDQDREKWSTSLMNSANVSDVMDCLVQLEQYITQSCPAVVQATWERRRREWLFGVKSAAALAHVFILTRYFLAEFVDFEALRDIQENLDRRTFLGLRDPEASTEIPSMGDNLIYFGVGHQAAIRLDSAIKSFVWQGDAPLQQTHEFTVRGITYHSGGGDPYARVTLRPVRINLGKTHRAGDLLCENLTATHKLGRSLRRIVRRMMKDRDADPFLELVSKAEYPEYYHIVRNPITLPMMIIKIDRAEYHTVDDFSNDVQLLLDNCKLFCEDRFPELLPMAERVVEVANSELRKLAPLIDAATSTEQEVTDTSDTDTSTEATNGLTVVLRLENRLPEFLIPVERYNLAVSQRYAPGQKFTTPIHDEKGELQSYEGMFAGSLPFYPNGLLPWEALFVVWDEDDGTDDQRINPWEADKIPVKKLSRRGR